MPLRDLDHEQSAYIGKLIVTVHQAQEAHFAEERAFRAGAEHWSTGRRVFKTMQFGLVHALIGIPIGAALALAIGGAYFMWTYLRRFRATGAASEALIESATR